MLLLSFEEKNMKYWEALGKKKNDSHPKKSAEKSILPKKIYIKITPRFTVRFFLGGLQHLFIEPSIAGCFAQFDTLQDDPP